MACGSCKKNNKNRSAVTDPSKYDLFEGVSVKSLNRRQVEARLALFKRKFCKTCGNRYKCTYEYYLVCKGTSPV